MWGETAGIQGYLEGVHENLSCGNFLESMRMTMVQHTLNMSLQKSCYRFGPEVAVFRDFDLQEVMKVSGRALIHLTHVPLKRGTDFRVSVINGYREEMPSARQGDTSLLAAAVWISFLNCETSHFHPVSHRPVVLHYTSSTRLI